MYLRHIRDVKRATLQRRCHRHDRFCLLVMEHSPNTTSSLTGPRAAAAVKHLMKNTTKRRGGRSKAGKVAQERAVSGHGQEASSSQPHASEHPEHPNCSNASGTDGDSTCGDTELARRLQEQMDLENEQCEHVCICRLTTLRVASQ